MSDPNTTQKLDSNTKCPTSKTIKARVWSITTNNNAKDKFEEYQKEEWITIKPKILWLVCQLEKVNHEHIQMGISFVNAVQFATVQKLFPGAHIEKARSAKHLWDYCCKAESRIENTEPFFWPSASDGPGQGKRNDLDELYHTIKDGADLEEIRETMPSHYIRYHSSINKVYREVKNTPRTEKPIVHWYWGLSETGKSETAHAINPESVYVKDGTQWWDNYNFEEVIIIDDFDGKYPYRTFLRLLDKYKHQEQVKGGYININSKYIIITCEYPPTYFWTGNELTQVTRRIDKTIKFTKSIDLENPGQFVYTQTPDKGLEHSFYPCVNTNEMDNINNAYHTKIKSTYPKDMYKNI